MSVANVVLRRTVGADHFRVAARALPLSFVVAIVAGDMLGDTSTVGFGRIWNEG